MGPLETVDWNTDEFWEAMEPALFDPARLALAKRDVDWLLAGLPLPSGSTVLDVGCGPGAHAIAFAERGHRVTGVDRVARYLARAAAAAAAARVEVEWVLADMREFSAPAAFDLICCLYTSFGFYDDRGNRKVAERMRENVRPSGAVVIDVITHETLAHEPLEPRAFTAGGASYEERREILRDGSHLVSHWLVTGGGQTSEFTVTQRLYFADELRDLLFAAGFTSVDEFGALDLRTPYDASAHRLVAVAKPHRRARRTRM